MLRRGPCCLGWPWLRSPSLQHHTLVRESSAGWLQAVGGCWLGAPCWRSGVARVGFDLAVPPRHPGLADLCQLPPQDAHHPSPHTATVGPWQGRMDPPWPTKLCGAQGWVHFLYVSKRRRFCINLSL